MTAGIVRISVYAFHGSMKSSCIVWSLVFVLTSLVFTSAGNSQTPATWREDFESFDGGQDFSAEGWTVFAGFRGDHKPVAKIIEGEGHDGSKALGVSCPGAFRSDNFGLTFNLPQAYSDGAVWVQFKFKAPAEWAAGLTFDARGPKREILSRVAASLFENPSTKDRELRWHCTWSKPHWRLYTLSELETGRWYTVTARLDLDGRTCAAWLDDQMLAEEAPLSAEAEFAQIYLGLGGMGESPAFVDDLMIGRQAPNGFERPQLLPEPEKDLIFRFSGLGDPQLGFGGYESDKVRFGLAVDQVNRAGAELSLILGDMVHDDKDENAYKDLAVLGKKLKQPTYVRGNHEELGLFQKHFNAKSDYSVVHGGLRFVVVDATGNQRGLTKEQLGWIEAEFQEASGKNEEIILALHVSPWQNNKKGAGSYNQIGPGRDQLRSLMKDHKVLLCLSGHYHTGLWGAKEEETHYLVLGGTAIVKGGTFGWCLFDVYPDRIVMHQKPLFFGYEKPGVAKVHGLQDWIPYETLRKMHPYVTQGPLTIPRHRPVAR